LNSIMAESVKFAIIESFQNQRFITIRTHHKEGDQEIIGIVTKIDNSLGRIKVSHNHGVEWIYINDILDVLIGLDD
jgi:hypothetical protein